MRRLVLLVTCAMWFSGCSGHAKELESLAARACECAERDTACGDQVLADLGKYVDSHGTADSDIERVTKAGVKIADCLSATGVPQKTLTGALARVMER